MMRLEEEAPILLLTANGGKRKQNCSALKLLTHQHLLLPWAAERKDQPATRDNQRQ